MLTWTIDHYLQESENRASEDNINNSIVAAVVDVIKNVTDSSSKLTKSKSSLNLVDSKNNSNNNSGITVNSLVNNNNNNRKPNDNNNKQKSCNNKLLINNNNSSSSSSQSARPTTLLANNSNNSKSSFRMRRKRSRKIIVIDLECEVPTEQEVKQPPRHHHRRNNGSKLSWLQDLRKKIDMKRLKATWQKKSPLEEESNIQVVNHQDNHQETVLLTTTLCDNTVESTVTEVSANVEVDGCTEFTLEEEEFNEMLKGCENGAAAAAAAVEITDNNEVDGLSLLASVSLNVPHLQTKAVEFESNCCSSTSSGKEEHDAVVVPNLADSTTNFDNLHYDTAYAQCTSDNAQNNVILHGETVILLQKSPNSNLYIINKAIDEEQATKLDVAVPVVKPEIDMKDFNKWPLKKRLKMHEYFPWTTTTAAFVPIKIEKTDLLDDVYTKEIVNGNDNSSSNNGYYRSVVKEQQQPKKDIVTKEPRTRQTRASKRRVPKVNYCYGEEDPEWNPTTEGRRKRKRTSQ